MLIVLVWFSHAQVQRTTNLGDVSLRFCNDLTETAGTKTAVLETKPEDHIDICMYINNDGPTKTSISLNFVDGTITADADQKKACEPEESKSNFGQYVTDYPTSIEINAGETVQISAKALFPAGYAGTSYGCATYQIINDQAETTESQMFTILSRRASFVDINVMGEYVVDLQANDANIEWSVKWLSSNQVSIVDHPIVPWNNISEVVNGWDIMALHVGKPLMVRSLLMNNGNVWLDVNVQSTYKAWWGLVDQDLGQQHQIILPKQSKAIEYQTNNTARWLGGPTTATHTVTYQPIIIGSGGIIDPMMLQPQTLTLVTQWLVTAYIGWAVIVVLLIIFIWYIVYRTRRSSRRRFERKHHKN